MAIPNAVEGQNAGVISCAVRKWKRVRREFQAFSACPRPAVLVLDRILLTDVIVREISERKRRGDVKVKGRRDDISISKQGSPPHSDRLISNYPMFEYNGSFNQ